MPTTMMLSPSPPSCSVLSTDVSAKTKLLLNGVTVGSMQKVYVYYEDAWCDGPPIASDC